MFKLEFETDNDAFTPRARPEIARILTRVAYLVRQGETDNPIRDINGNTVGRWEFTP